jgi:hypothetical protein
MTDLTGETLDFIGGDAQELASYGRAIDSHIDNGGSDPEYIEKCLKGAEVYIESIRDLMAGRDDRV